MIRIFNNQRIGVRHIDPGFNNGRGHQYVIRAMQKIIDDIFQLGFRHLAMGIPDAGVRH